LLIFFGVSWMVVHPNQNIILIVDINFSTDCTGTFFLSLQVFYFYFLHIVLNLRRIKESEGEGGHNREM
jgi:hypothetical protein